jgi:hypothetical protein
LILRAEHRLKVFENRVLRTIFELKRDEIIGGRRKLHNEELLGLFSWNEQLENNEMGRSWDRYECKLGFNGKARKKEISRNT